MKISSLSISDPLKSKSGYRWGFLLLLVGCLGFLLGFYGKVLMNPNSYLFSQDSDGIKNYYTYAYFVQNNQSDFFFEGSNYPYGEVIIYTDCNILLAYCMRAISSIFPGITHYSIGILNGFMILSFFLTALFLFLIFKKLKVHPLLSVAGALSIMILSPQVFRLSGHYGLSYGFVIPFTIYLLILHESKYMLRYGLLLSIHVLFCFFLHPYLGLIVASLLFSYIFSKWLMYLRTKEFYSLKNFFVFVSAIIPISLFYAFTKILDDHLGRTKNPYGFFEYYADFDTILLPNHPPFQFLVRKFLPPFTQTWEGWSYIGVAAIIVSLLLCFICLRKLLKGSLKQFMVSDFSNKILTALFFSSVFMLMFSMGIPFRFLPKHYLDYFSFIKEFRTIGRFAWIFFFVINIITIYFVDRLGKKLFVSGRQLMAYTFFMIVPCLIGFEGIFYHIEVSKKISVTQNLFNKAYIPGSLDEVISAVDPDRYQAVIPLPYYHIGSENYMKESSNQVYLSSMLFSYHAGMNLVSNYGTRTSIPETKKLLQLLGSNYYKKEIEADIRSALPFLVLYIRGEKLNVYESEIRKKGKLIYRNDEYELLEIEKKQLFSGTVDLELAKFDSIRDQLFNHNGFLTDDTLSYIFYNGFDTAVNTTMINFRGKGTLEFMKNDRLILAEIPAEKFPMNVEYVAGFWIYNDGYNYGEDVLNNLDFTIIQVNPDEQIIANTQPKTSMVINNDWTMVELSFTMKVNQGTLRFVLEGKDWKNRKMYLDDVFIYPMLGTYYRIDRSEGNKVLELFLNNHQLRRSTN